MKPELSSFQQALLIILRLEEKSAKLWREELRKMPEGGLIIKPAGGRYYFDRVLSGERSSITHDLDLIYKLARKKYLKLKLQEHEKQYGFRRGQYVLNPKPLPASKQIRFLLDRYKKAHLDLLRITLSPEQYHWVHEDYPRDVIQPGEKYYETYSGIRMRSKSERDIGNELEMEGIPYRYGQKVMLKIGWVEGVRGNVYDDWKAYYPDFIILTASGEKIVWEHLGRLDLLDYRMRNAEKFAAARQGGYVSEEMLIMTVERDLEDGNFIRDIIVRRILPYM
ncbi:MAG: hypothetical protein IJ109_09225 [Firmicutes bacterium]|nr:hypothetical protein [Bacillota bacterium]